MTNKDRVEIKQLPDWLRRAMALPERFRKGHAKHVPFEVEVTFNDVLERMLAGFGRNLQAVSNLKMKTLVDTAQQILDAWRECCEKFHKDYIFQCLFVSHAVIISQDFSNRRYCFFFFEGGEFVKMIFDIINICSHFHKTSIIHKKHLPDFVSNPLLWHVGQRSRKAGHERECY